MTAGNDNNFSRVEASYHVDGLTSVGERAPKKKQQGKDKQKRKKQQIDQQLEEELRNEEEKNKDGHIDFHA